MNSEEPRLLAFERKMAIRHYAWAVAELKRQITTCTAEDWRKFHRVVEEARHECERIRDEEG